MGRLYRILHFSDIHAGLLDFHWGYLADKRLFGSLTQLFLRSWKLRLERLDALAALQKRLAPDITVFTGDLGSIGSEAEFANAARLLEPIRANARGNFLFVPGNHDAYVPVCQPALAEICRRLNGGRLDAEAFPAVISDGPVEFVALNPSRPAPVWLSDGAMTDAVWAKVGYILQNPAPAGKTRLLLTHFPLVNAFGKAVGVRRRMRDGGRLLRLCRQGGVRAILSGHIHHPFIQETAADGPLQLCAGSLTLAGACIQVDVDTEAGTIVPRIIRL